MKPAPLVTIAIPAFNPQFFLVALESALSQTYANLEVVVCDDSDGNEIRELVDACEVPVSIRLRYVRNPQRLGFQGNLAACAQEANGDYLKLLCDDDQLLPECIAQQVAGFIDHGDVNLVIGQRQFFDEDSILLSDRLENSCFSKGVTLFKGEDLLGILESSAFNFLSGLSGALIRTRHALEYLPALTQIGEGFVAHLDFALFTCLLRRGNLVVVGQILSLERLHPARLSNQPAVKVAVVTELDWLKQMLALRSGEPAPAAGWVRHVALADAIEGQAYAWEEAALGRQLGFIQTLVNSRVGPDCESFADMYQQWLSCRHLNPAQQRLLDARVRSWSWRPRIVPIVLDSEGDLPALDDTLNSLRQQAYSVEQVVVLSAVQRLSVEGVRHVQLGPDAAAQFNDLLAGLDNADWIYLLRAGDRVHELALLLLAERMVEMPDVRCLYSDEGGLRDEVSIEPVFKPDFNLDLMRSFPYVGRVLALQRQRMLELGGMAAGFGELGVHDLLWRLVENNGPHAIGHIAEVLVESTFRLSQWLTQPQVNDQAPRVLAAHLARLGIPHRIRAGSQSMISRVDYLHDQSAMVSIIIATRNELSSLERCIESLLEKTACQRFEVIIVDNGSTALDACNWLSAVEQMGSDKLRVLRCDHGDNLAAVHNFAASQASGDYLLFFSPCNNVVNPDWLDELLNHAQRPEVGIVGGRLVSPQGRIEGAALVLGLRGAVGVPNRGELLNTPGYMQRQQAVQNFSAVGIDCLLVRRQVFDEVLGLDEKDLSQALNGADFCLRVKQNGYLVVWTPYAELMRVTVPTYAEPAPRILQNEQKSFYERWLPLVARDPAYNPNLSLGSSNFSLEPGFKNGWDPFSRQLLPKVLAIPINTSAVGHYRVAQPFIELEAAGRIGGHLSYHTPTNIELERSSPDVIVLQGRYSQNAVDEVERVKSASRAFRIFELDDYVIDVPKKNAHIRKAQVGVDKIVRRGISLCDRVVVSTQPLADALRDMHHDIRVVPNMLAPHLWAGLSSRRRTSCKPRVGWGGGTSHDGDLAIIADVVRLLANEVEWVFFGMCPPALRPFVHEFHASVGLDAYPAKLASLNLDLALAPLEFHIFNDCKSNLRLLEYGACGYPVICTETEAYRGYLPCTKVVSNSTEEWLEAIRMHLSDPDASYRMGDALREEVLRDYLLKGSNLNYWAEGWLPD
ncbi:glycosyltransferase [Pseudomonas monsensis]